jgi:hypothetical protein
VLNESVCKNKSHPEMVANDLLQRQIGSDELVLKNGSVHKDGNDAKTASSKNESHPR